MSSKHRRAIVTGGASGIAAAGADRLKREGAQVIRLDLTPNLM